MSSSKQTTVMVSIATGQSAANILPVMIHKPDQVVIVQSDKMVQAAQALQTWLKDWSDYREDQITIHPGLPNSGLNDLEDFALDLRGHLEEQWPDSRLILNATGGNKLMTLAFVEVFRDSHQDSHQDSPVNILYTDTENDCLEVIEPKKHQPQPIPPVFNLRSYLASQGYTTGKAACDDKAWCTQADQRKQLTKHLAQNIDQLIKEDGTGLLPQLNGVISREVLDRHRNLRPSTEYQELNYVPANAHQHLKRLSENQLITWSADNSNIIQFRSAEAVRYIGGQWLEEYVWHIACNAGIKSDCMASGLNIISKQYRKDNMRNELDLAIVHNNRLLLIECKTGRIDKEERDSQAIYKLDSLGNHAGGLFCQRLLISATPLDHKTRDGYKVKVESRAKSYDVDVLQHRKLKKFKDILLHWMETGQLDTTL